MSYHPVVQQITDLLKQNNRWFESFEHKAVKTSEEAAKLRDGYTLHQGAKAMIVRLKLTSANKKFAMLVLPGDCRFNNSKVKVITGAKDIRFATEEEVAELTGGIQSGGVPPFGNLFGLEVFLDDQMINCEKIIFNAGDRRFSVAIFCKDYIELVKPKIVSLV